MLTQKNPPSVGDANLDRVIRQIYNDINEIIANIPTTQTSLPRDQAPEGSMKVTKETTDSFVLSVKTNEGWIDTKSGTFTFNKLSE